MIYKYHILQSTLIFIILQAIVINTFDSAEPSLMEQTLAAIKDCMTGSPCPWPEAWQSEYLDTISQAIEPHQGSPEYLKRLEILSNGFRTYWKELRKSNDRSLFEVQCAQIRWYIEHLMTTELPGEDERQKLRNQYEDLWDHSASLLLTQFPFLDPDVVQKAKANHLSDCFNKIETPLLPIFMRPFSETEVEQIKQRWHDLRYTRIDLWQSLGGEETKSIEIQDVPSIDTHPHYLLTQRSLAQLLLQVWKVAAIPPDYYQAAATNLMNVERQRLQARSHAFKMERRLERERSRQFLQTEEIGFLLAALVETAQHPRRSSSAVNRVLSEEVMPMT